jgi:hypothetical protein
MPELRRLNFVVLHHTGIENPHYDLLVDPGPPEPLWTWRLSKWPADGALVYRVADHRREYLSYEGTVTGDRGEVRRVAAGQLTFDADAHELSLDNIALKIRL